MRSIFSMYKEETKMSNRATTENTYVCRMAAFLARPVTDLHAVVDLHS